MNKNISINHKCPSCHANLTFNPQNQNWVCEYCDSKFNLKDLKNNNEKYNEKKVEEESNSSEFDVYKCPDCGAQIITDANTVATFCVYCKNTSIIKERLVGKFELKHIIPFQKTKEEAVEAFKKLSKGHPFMPNEFTDPKNISEIRGVYVPFWLFSSTVTGHLVSDCKKVHHRRSGNYEYITTETFEVIRDGEVSFNYIPNDGSKKFDDAIINSIEPYDYKKLTEFSPSYLSGFYAEKYDLDDKEAQKIIDFRIKNTVQNLLSNNIKGYTHNNIKTTDISYNNNKMEYVFLPVWFLNIKYKDNFYTFAMNGETGKLTGNIPVDKRKAFITFLIVFTVTFIICLTIFYLFIRSNV